VVKRLWKLSLRPCVDDDGEPRSSACRPGPGRWASSRASSSSRVTRNARQPPVRGRPARVRQQADPGRPAAPERRRRGRPILAVRSRAVDLSPPSPAASVEGLSPDFSGIESRLDELRRRGEAGQIAALVMQVAREFLRARDPVSGKEQTSSGAGWTSSRASSRTQKQWAPPGPRDRESPSIGAVGLPGRRRGRPTPSRGPSPKARDPRPDGQDRPVPVEPHRAHEPLLTHREPSRCSSATTPETGRDVGRLDAFGRLHQPRPAWHSRTRSCSANYKALRGPDGGWRPG
jgi:hypothetical protein